MTHSFQENPASYSIRKKCLPLKGSHTSSVSMHTLSEWRPLWVQEHCLVFCFLYVYRETAGASLSLTLSLFRVGPVVQASFLLFAIVGLKPPTFQRHCSTVLCSLFALIFCFSCNVLIFATGFKLFQPEV